MRPTRRRCFDAAGEVNIADFVNHVAQQVAVNHPVDCAFENRGDDIAPVAAVNALAGF